MIHYKYMVEDDNRQFRTGDVVVSTLDGQLVWGPATVLRGAYSNIDNCVVYVVRSSKGTYLMREWELDLFDEYRKRSKLDKDVKKCLE